MPSYRHAYQSSSFRDVLHAEEERERHLLHQVAHIWLGESFGATLTALNINQGGTSDVTLNGRLTLAQHYQVGVAGLLAEAQGIMTQSRRQPQLDVDRMAILAGRIFAEVSAHRGDLQHSEALGRILDARRGTAAVISRPEQQGNQGDEDIQQVGVDVSLLKHSEPGKQSCGGTEYRQDRLVEHRVAHLAVKHGRSREQSHVRGLADPRTQYPAEEPHQHLGE